jgi:hypothetical protein
MVNINTKFKGDANKFADQVREGVESIAGQLKIGKALIFNGTDKPVNFYVYNYIDTVYWVAAMHTLVAPGKVGAVAASGTSFKVHPDDDKAKEFLVDPGKAYLYGGPGDVEEVKK